MPQESSGIDMKQVLYGAAAAALFFGGVWYLYRRAEKSRVDQMTFIEGSPEAQAKQIRMAIENDSWFNAGTNNEVLRKVLQAVPSKEHFAKVIRAYHSLYGSNMMDDLKKDLSLTEYNEMLAILSVKPDQGTTLLPVSLSPAQYESWAKRINAAVNYKVGPFPATDEDAIDAVIAELPTQAAYEELEKVYMRMFGSSMKMDLSLDLEPWEYWNMLLTIGRKPKT